GNYSFGIFLIHSLVKSVLNSLPVVPSLLRDFPPLSSLYIIALTILCCMGIIFVSRKLLGKISLIIGL
ncbi:MAG: hypothetical protein LBT89_09215, partial [Planctomycetaceae bacterium]|nr:hypothetical protein [Planctomycetaceae bacterium]